MDCRFVILLPFSHDKTNTSLMVSSGGNDIYRIRHDSRGLSNVVVVMLSLIILVIIVVNVVLWGYQMNQYDLQRAQEDVKITGVDSGNGFSPWFTAQNEYAIDAGSNVNGTYAETQSIDGSGENFTGSTVLAGGLNWWNTNYDYRRRITITNNAASSLIANYSVSVTIDTVSLISSGKLMTSGNDLRVLFDSGSSWVELDREVDGINTPSTQVWFETQATIPVNASDNNYYLYYGNPNAGNPPANESNVYLWFDDFNRANEPDITAEPAYTQTNGGTWSIVNDTLMNAGASGDPNKLIIAALGNVSAPVDMLVKMDVASFAGGDTSRMGLSCCMDSSGGGYCAVFHNDENSLDLLNDLRSWGTHGTYSWSLNTWYYMRFRVVDPSSGLGEVKVWPVGTTEPTAWTVSGDFGSGSVRDFGEIGFAGSKTSDATYFDDITIRYIANPEPSTSLQAEEGQFNNRLEIDGTFLVDVSTYPLSSVQTAEISMAYKSSDSDENWYLEAYNWTSLTYSDFGFNSTSGNFPTTGWNNYAVNLTDQWSSYINSNGTIIVKIFDQGADAEQTTIDIDFVGVRVEANLTTFTFENDGSFTAHLVDLWIDNSTLHQRYDISVYINSGDTASYFSADINLPQKPYIIKIITERGNIAINSTS
jgi:nitrogen fixation-related uncharacterized protein